MTAMMMTATTMMVKVTLPLASVHFLQRLLSAGAGSDAATAVFLAPASAAAGAGSDAATAAFLAPASAAAPIHVTIARGGSTGRSKVN